MILINTLRIKRVARLGRLCSVVLLALPAGGCGFRLVGSGALPAELARTYVETSEPRSEFADSLRTALRSRGLDVVERADDATARLIVSEDSTGQRVLSVSARNIPREYEVYYAITFALETDAGRVIEDESLTLTRSYTFDETQVLGKSREERVLRRALADDLAQRVVRRIEAVGEADAAPES